MHHKYVVFPFTAIVGQDLMKLALEVNAVEPSIGGVLIKGDKGTGKSTAVRALAKLLPVIRTVSDCPFNCDPDFLKFMCKSCQERVEHGEKLPWIKKNMEVIDMPLSATEDMLVGTLDIKKVLKEGIKALEPGLLAKANRNILYIDEVNLLDDYLANMLLDSAAMGVNTIEREGVSVYHPARFILIGTMNPEEGDLRPQIIDRFGLCVTVEALSSIDGRLEVMKRRKAFDTDPWKFEDKFSNEQKKLQTKILNAQVSVEKVIVSQEILQKIVTMTTALGIKTHRADIVMEKTARAIAALEGRKKVTEEDLKKAALLALPHRLKQNPFDKKSQLNTETIDKLTQSEKMEEQIFDFNKDLTINKNILENKNSSLISGKDSANVESNRGRYIRARDAETPKSIAVDATLRKAIRQTGRLEVLPEHLMEKVRVSKGKSVYYLLLDSSSSMSLDKKIRMAKSLAWQLLKRSYEKKSRVALIVFQGQEPELVVPPTSDLLRIDQALENVPTGGKTPLTPAIKMAFEDSEKETEVKHVVIVISDGRGNVFFNQDLEMDLKQLDAMKKDATLIFINAENRGKSLGVLENMAEAFHAPHYYLEEIL